MLVSFPKFGRFILAGIVSCAGILMAEPQANPSNHWSLKAVVDVPLPEVAHPEWVRSRMDRFILAKLEAKGLTPSPAAEKLTLLRRASFDLIGLPPAVDMQDRFLKDQSPAAFSKIVDELLASPQYGERWGRHWLDVARYADTAGESADYPIPEAYRYRNWVIDAFNADMPYDEFLRQQIAGDLLPSARVEEKHSKLIATGFISLARRFSVEPDSEMHLTIEDTLDTLSKATMGLSLSCARCHDHKFDPISSKDYYALYGIFSSTRYPFPGSENKKRQRDLIPLVDEETVAKAFEPVKDRLAEIDAQSEDLKAQREALRAMREGRETPVKPTLSFGELMEKQKKLQEQRQKVTDLIDPIPSAFAIAEGKSIADAPVQKRGEPYNRGEMVPRHFLTALGGQMLPPDEKGSGRRQLAEWIATPQNPLTARVMVNRVWQHHFGRGLVATPNDFGVKGQAPSHPELLDWLTARFVEEGWSLKKLHQRIMRSATYQQSSVVSQASESADPSNELLSHFPRLRLDAEATRDAMLSVSQNLDSTPGGPHPFPEQKTWAFTQHGPFTATYETSKRSVYLMQQRIRKHPFLAIFDGADTNTSTGSRQLSTTPLQALFMMNDPFCHAQATGLAERIQRSAAEPSDRMNNAHRICFGRPATTDEISRSLEWLEVMKSKFPPEEAEAKAWESFARVLLGSNEFVYLD